MNARWLLVPVAIVVALALARTAQGQDKDKKDEEKKLRWGTDPSGAPPYVYKDEHDKYVGFEVELAEYLAKELGRKSEMVPGDWKTLPELLGKPDDDEGIDIVLNGYELRENLEKSYPSTIPYYVYRLSLVIHKDDIDDIKGWGDLTRPNSDGKKRKVGTLSGSVAQKYVSSKTFAGKFELQTSDDVAPMIDLVERKRIDATIQDNPAALYYSRKSKDLALADEPRKPGYYVILTRPADKELREQLNAALRKGIKDGTLKKIYEKYGLWNEDQERLYYWADQPWPPPFTAEQEEGVAEQSTQLWKLFRDLVKAAGMTVFLAVASFPLAMLLGMFVALGRVYGPWIVRFPLGVYVEILRGTPLLLQLYFMFYLVPVIASQHLGINVSGLLVPVVAGILGLAINYSAYEAENYRAGLLAIPRGQMEAALALGMNPFTAIRVVIVPQAVRIVIPPVTNDFIALFKDTSVCSVILITELTRQYNELYNFNREYIIQLAFMTAGLYLIMSYPLAIVARQLEMRLGTVGGTHR